MNDAMFGGEDAVVAAFLQDCLADQTRGATRSLAEYQALYPGFEACIASEYRAVFDDAEPRPAPSEVGVLGRFRLLESIGRGGQGEVFLADDTALGRKVALKVLRNLAADGAVAVARFRREAMAAARLTHPGICRVLEVGAIDAVPFLAMEFVAGRSLARWVEDHREAGQPPPWRTAVRIVGEVAHAVGAAHAAGILHRDVKPGNVIVRPDGSAVVLDFGLAHVDSDGASLTRTGDVFGTPDYMAPEQLLQGPQALDARSDVWALGVTLFECVTLRRPFRAPTRQALVRAILEDEVEDLRRVRSDVSRDLAAVVATALHPDRDRRYSSARAFAEDLDRLLRGEPVRARAIGRVERIARYVRRRPWQAALAAAGIVLCAGVGFAAGEWPRIRADRAEIDRLARQREVDELLDRAFLELAEGEPATARSLFDAVISRDARHPLAHAGVVLAIEREQPAMGVRSAFLRDAAGASLVQRLYLPSGRLVERAALDGALDEVAASTDPAELFLAAHIANTIGHSLGVQLHERAATLARLAIDAAPQPTSVQYFELAHSLSHLDDHAAAERLAEVLVGKWPHSGTAWYWRGMLLRARRPGMASAAFLRSATLDEKSILALTQLAEFYSQARDTGALLVVAEEAARRADHRNVRLALARAWARSGRLDEADATLATLVRDEPDWAAAYTERALLARARGDRAAAVRDLRRAVEVGGASWRDWNNLGDALASVGDRDGAIGAFRAAIERGSTVRSSFRALGRLLTGSRRHGEAEECFRQATVRWPDDVGAWYELACAAHDAGHLDVAERAYTRAIELRPGFVQAIINRAQILIRRGRAREALPDLRSAVERAVADPTWRDRDPRVLLKDAEELAAGEAAIERMDREGIAPSADEITAAARAAANSGRVLLAARWFERAIALSPSRMPLARAGGHLDAALCAARLGLGTCADAALVALEERGAWRLSAIEWLRIDLGKWQRAVSRGDLVGPARTWLESWKDHAELRPLADPGALATRPAAEAEACAAFWREVDALLASIRR